MKQNIITEPFLLKDDYSSEVNTERWLEIEDYPGEIWNNLPGYEGLYQVSNIGRVKRLPSYVRFNHGIRRIRGGIKKVHLQNNGYFIIDLYKNNKRKNMLLHRAVALSFIPNPLNLPVINHKDNNRTNDVVTNLEWCDMSYNMKYSYDTTDRRSKMNWKSGKENANSKEVVAFNKQLIEVARFDSILDASRKLGICDSGIVSCLKGRTKTYKGYIWHYAK